MDIIVGIDPGIHGGVAWINGTGAGAMPMPLTSGSESDLDKDVLISFLRWADGAAKEGILFVYIEEVHAMPKQGVVSMFTFGYDAGRLRGIADGLGLPVRTVHPRAWKTRILGEYYSHDKAGAIAYCDMFYPQVSLTPERKRVPHDGMADALCIATYGWQETHKIEQA